MPTFRMEKLVRDGLLDKYAALGQEVECEELPRERHLRLLVRKVIEEVMEIPLDKGGADEVASEIGDAQQALSDLRDLLGLSAEQVEIARQGAYDDRGGFINGSYVKTITTRENDEWNDYYRARPDLYPEVIDE